MAVRIIAALLMTVLAAGNLAGATSTEVSMEPVDGASVETGVWAWIPVLDGGLWMPASEEGPPTGYYFSADAIHIAPEVRQGLRVTTAAAVVVDYDLEKGEAGAQADASAITETSEGECVFLSLKGGAQISPRHCLSVG